MNESLTQVIFEKPVHSLNELDIVNYFQTGKTETDKLEFKSYIDYSTPHSSKATRDKEKLNDIFKTICAFLNSEGGVLIWGAPDGEVPETSKEEIFRGNLTPVKLKLERDQFTNKLAAEISPTPLGIKFQPIPTDGGFVYVIEVNQSEFAPHQFKGTYYMRMDGSTRHAPHHYVEALMKKVSFPKVRGHLEFGKMIDLPNNLAALPLLLTLDNISKYIHERNLSFHLLSGTCSILDASKSLDSQKLSHTTDMSKLAKDILHYGMPYYQQLVLVTNRLVPRNTPLEVEILLTFWGDLSPAICSYYKLQFFGDRNMGNTEYSMLELKENIHIEELNGPSDISEDEKNEKSRKFLMSNYQSQFHQTTFFTQMNR